MFLVICFKLDALHTGTMAYLPFHKTIFMINVDFGTSESGGPYPILPAQSYTYAPEFAISDRRSDTAVAIWAYSYWNMLAMTTLQSPHFCNSWYFVVNKFKMTGENCHSSPNIEKKYYVPFLSEG
jgi:hypothetical protein